MQRRPYSEIVLEALRAGEWTTRTYLSNLIKRERHKLSPGALTKTLDSLVRSKQVLNRSGPAIAYRLLSPPDAQKDKIKTQPAPVSDLNMKIQRQCIRDLKRGLRKETVVSDDEAGYGYGNKEEVGQADRHKDKGKEKETDSSGSHIGLKRKRTTAVTTTDNSTNSTGYLRTLEARVKELEHRVLTLEDELRETERADARRALEHQQHQHLLQQQQNRWHQSQQHTRPQQSHDHHSGPKRARRAALPEAFANMIRAAPRGNTNNSIMWCIRQQNVDNAKWVPLPKAISNAIQRAYEEYAFKDHEKHTYVDNQSGLRVQFVGMFGYYNNRAVRFLRTQ